jgi:uncharacterized protein
MKKEILSHLNEVERKYNVEILYAADTGSRSYGTHKDSSDYDLRIIYRYNKERYLQLYRPKAHFELKLEKNIELFAWDIYKTAELAIKSNPSLYEMMKSSNIYIVKGTFITMLKEKIENNFSLFTLAMHYKKMTFNNIKLYQRNENIKTLLQTVRAFLMLRWIVTECSLPPITYVTLINQVQAGEIRELFITVLQCKLENKNITEAASKQLISYISAEMERLSTSKMRFENDTISMDDINQLIMHFWENED